jgi:hypothetical protein
MRRVLGALIFHHIEREPMRTLLATLALATSVVPPITNAGEPAVRVAQMARDVTDAVRKQRAERHLRPRHGHQSHQ